MNADSRTSSDPNPPKVSIVIPIYNEEAILRTAIVDLIDGLGRFEWTYEIVLTENGSTDRTVEVCGELAERFPAIRHLHHAEPNYGKALRNAMLTARGEYVVCDEIDLCDTDFYERALAILERREADLIVGSKLLEGARDERPWLRHTGTIVINTMLRWSLGFRGTDTHGLKAFRRQRLLPIVHACLVDKDLFASEFVIRAERAGIAIREIPVKILEKRPPSIHLVRRVPNVLKNLARLVVAIRVKG